MPTRPPRLCLTPGCGEIASSGRFRCPACLEKQQEDAQKNDRLRGTAAQRGYGYKWQRFRARWIKKHPICEDPYGWHPGEVREVSDIDHIIPHKGNMKLFWDKSNLQGLCSECHKRKTALEQRGTLPCVEVSRSRQSSRI